MKRHPFLFLSAVAAVIAAAALAPEKKPKLLLLEWASKAKMETPPVAVLIEMGQKDDKPVSWSGRATAAGAKVVHREGYRFRQDDKLIEPDGWEASSHRGQRVPPGRPGLFLREPIATVGVVLHLADLKPDATITLSPAARAGEEKLPQEVVALSDVLAGKPKLLWKGRAAVRLISTAAPVVTAKTEDDFPAACYGPDGTLWVAYISYTLKDENCRVERASLKEQPKDFKDYYKPEFGDQLFVKSFKDGKWSEPIAVTGPKEDLMGCAIAAEKSGAVSVFYSANRNGVFKIYRRILDGDKPGEEKRLGPKDEENQIIDKENDNPIVSPVACTNQAGKVYWHYQSWSSPSVPPLRTHWNPAIAASPEGEIAMTEDTCNFGASRDFDIFVRIKNAAENIPIATSSKFEARPSIAYDPQGRLWIAYEEGPERWGKDYGALAPGQGNPLYNERSVRVVCLQDGKLMKPAALLPTSSVETPRIPYEGKVPSYHTYELGTRYAYPKIGIDGQGRVWLTYRQKFGSRNTTHLGSYWLSFARRLDGDHWSEPIELHHSDGMLDSRPVLLPHSKGGLLVVHNTDGRFTTPETIDNQIYMSYLDLPGEPVEPKLLPHEPGKKDENLVKEAEEERAAVKRCREYRLESGGKKYQFLRGEFHRHTEISWDGGPDGSLEDMFRYAIDAAAFDWIGNGDHDNGAGREYSWWLTQKFTDAYHVKGVFTPMFTYERSVNYPHGHRNCMFAQRGVRTLPRLAEENKENRVGGVHADDAKMLYRYLKELDGICASHTSATAMGTDWRDHDPQVEPVVEIYQGDRMSYEREGAPRAGYDPKTGKEPANIAGWFPKGFVNNALQQGHRLGFQASSDHWSTHISYCTVLAERHDRAAILAALKKRHVYAATDNIIADVQSGPHLMGDEFKTSAAPELQIHVIGTKALAQIDILKDSDVVETIKPGKQEYQGAWTDPKPSPGTHYYYVRVQQEDKELAWTSPLWIEYVK